jgi:hypothetical protein
MNAYRFFHLIDLSDKPTTAFQQLVTAKNEDRKVRIVELLEIGYPEIMAHELATMTPKMLDSLMEEYNVNGETKKKAVTFFLQAAKHSGVQLSNFLTERIRSTNGVKRRRKSEDVTDDRIQRPPSIHGSSRSVTLAEGGTVTLTISVDVFSLGKDDREFVFGLIDQLQKYEAQHPSDDDEGESEDDGQV